MLLFDFARVCHATVSSLWKYKGLYIWSSYCFTGHHTASCFFSGVKNETWAQTNHLGSSGARIAWHNISGSKLCLMSHFYSADFHVDMIKCTLHQVLRLPNYILYFYNNCDITFLTVFILTHPVNFPCGRKPGHPEKTHDFRQSVDRLFSHESVAIVDPRTQRCKARFLVRLYATVIASIHRIFVWLYYQTIFFSLVHCLFYLRKFLRNRSLL